MFGDIAVPLTPLTGNNATFKWDKSSKLPSDSYNRPRYLLHRWIIALYIYIYPPSIMAFNFKVLFYLEGLIKPFTQGVRNSLQSYTASLNSQQKTYNLLNLAIFKYHFSVNFRVILKLLP